MNHGKLNLDRGLVQGQKALDQKTPQGICLRQPPPAGLGGPLLGQENRPATRTFILRTSILTSFLPAKGQKECYLPPFYFCLSPIRITYK